MSGISRQAWTSCSAATSLSISSRRRSSRWSGRLPHGCRDRRICAWPLPSRCCACRPPSRCRPWAVHLCTCNRDRQWNQIGASVSGSIVRVLIVDDSAYVRKVVAQMLSRSPFLEVVATARDGREALEAAHEHAPDVITCDLNMPEMDGVAFVTEQMARRPVPILIMSVANRSGEQALAALEAGAVDFVHKPTALASERLLEVAEELIQKVKAAAMVPMPRLRQIPAAPPAVVAP